MGAPLKQFSQSQHGACARGAGTEKTRAAECQGEGGSDGCLRMRVFLPAAASGVSESPRELSQPASLARPAGSMPGRAAHQEAAAGSAGAATQPERGLAGAFPLVLKKLMENPPRDARLGA